MIECEVCKTIYTGSTHQCVGAGLARPFFADAHAACAEEILRLNRLIKIIESLHADAMSSLKHDYDTLKELNRVQCNRMQDMQEAVDAARHFLSAYNENHLTSLMAGGLANALGKLTPEK